MPEWLVTPPAGRTHSCVTPNIDGHVDGTVITCPQCGQRWEAKPTDDWSEWVRLTD